MPKFFVTTPSYRTYADPHLGTAYPVVLADAVARYQRMKGMEVLLATCIQECPQRVVGTPAAQGRDLAEIAEAMAHSYAQAWEALSISDDRFTRSSRPLHQHNVQEVIVKLLQAGEIYWGTCRGWFCLADEVVWQPWQLMETLEPRCPNPECQRPLEWLETETYLFRISQHLGWLYEYLEAHPYSIQPEIRRQEFLGRFRKAGARALLATDPHISRISDWGPPLPAQLAQGKEMRVSSWFDLLLQYLTAAWYGDDDLKFRQFWPPDVHLVGNDLMGDYHLILWPILLMACDLPAPKSIFIHGFWQYQGSKISKSSGPRVSLQGVIEAVARLAGCPAESAADALRYFLLREPAIIHGAEFSMEALARRFNTELAAGLERTMDRTLRVIKERSHGTLPSAAIAETGIPAIVQECWQEADRAYDALDVPAVLAAAWHLIERLQEMLGRVELHGRPRADEAAIAGTAQGLASAVLMLAPAIPTTSQTLLTRLGVLPELGRYGWWLGGRELLPLARSATLIPPGTRLKAGPLIFPPIRTTLGELTGNQPGQEFVSSASLGR